MNIMLSIITMGTCSTIACQGKTVRPFTIPIALNHYYLKKMKKIGLRLFAVGGGTLIQLAYKIMACDVTGFPRWLHELHEPMHFTGQDLASALLEVLQKEGVFTLPCVNIVARLGVGS